MKLKTSNLIIFIVLSILSIALAGCNLSNAGDPTENEKIVQNAKALQYGFPYYFIHPGAYRPPNTNLQKSERGTVAWTPADHIGSSYQLDDKETYTRRLENAGILLQSSYSEYKQIDGAGFPGLYQEIDGVYHEEPEAKYQAGYVCYSFVARAMKDAGITLVQGDPYGMGYILYQCTEITTINNTTVKSGDFVVYDFENGLGGYNDHIGILTEVIGTEPESWKVISCSGLVEVFEWGVAETDLGAFQDISNGGVFDWMPYPVKYKIYTNRNL